MGDLGIWVQPFLGLRNGLNTGFFAADSIPSSKKSLGYDLGAALTQARKKSLGHSRGSFFFSILY